MKLHRLEREQWIPRPLDEVFDFFARAENLADLTPHWLGFEILQPLPIAMGCGTRIEYRIRLAGLPLRWRTRISVWDPPRRFVDVMSSGPYAYWEHRHDFEPLGAGVLMRDRVDYALPLGPLGTVAHVLAVRAALAAIFDHRYRRVRELLG